MTIQEMLGQSAILTVLGMCVVFAFLIIMIGFMNLLRVVIHAAKLDKEAPKAESAAPAAAQVDLKAVVAAIATALPLPQCAWCCSPNRGGFLRSQAHSRH